ncbi:MAG: acetyltransferase [Gammaproteobacteria bacterium]|nr:acetyltransferase [Gammaproteobacteria bacterium]
MEKPIVIFGSGGLGREVLQLIRDINALQPTWTCLGFLVDSRFASQSIVQGIPVLGGIEWLDANADVAVVVAIGSSAERLRITNRIRSRCQNSFATLVHPLAWIGENVVIGDGSIICAGALITTDIKIHEHVQVNIGSTIGHDAVLGDFVSLNPSVNVSGSVTLMEGVEIGTGSVIIPGCVVGEWSIVGAGSVVTKRIKENSTAVGAPARVIKERSCGWQTG